MLANWNRPLLFAGVFLTLLGVFHVGVQWVEPRAWESLIGWRKPILFGISTGVTLISLAWVVSVVGQKRAQLAAWVISVLACAEVLIITVQTWRGVPAHFNNGARLDQILTNSVDAMLVGITLAIFYLTAKSFWHTAAVEDADYLLSIRLGLVYLCLACLLGFAVAIYGNYVVSVGGDPAVVAPNGVPKFVHGMPLHALQILPLWIFAASFVNTNVNRRKTSVWFVSHAIGLTTVYALWQTLNGAGRFEANVIGVVLLCAAGVCGFAALYHAAFGVTKPAGWRRQLGYR